MAREAIRGFLEALPVGIAAIVIIAVLFAIYCMVNIFKAKRPKCRTLYLIGIWIMILSSTVGVFAFAGPTGLDRCKRWFTWFGDGIEAQLLTYICIVILLGAAIMIIAFLIPFEGSYQIWNRTNEVVGRIEKKEEITVTASDDGFLRIKLPDGTEGYISRSDVEVVRIPLRD